MRVHGCGVLVVVMFALAVPSQAGSADGVTVTAKQEVYAKGDQVDLVIENNSGGTIFVPGCHPFEVENFKEEAYARVSREPCKWEGVAQAIPEGTHEFSYTTGDVEGSGIFRISLVYGTGCEEGAPLGRARCDDFATALSGSFRVGG